MKITYFGHSAFLVETNEKSVLIDPFITGNPHAEQAGIQADALNCDAILLTHGHEDHLGDTEAIAKRTGALVVATFELAMYLQAKGCAVHPMGLGGRRSFEFGEVQFTLAHHSSSVIDDNGVPVYLGNPAGIIFQAEGKTLYHAGDTALFMDMQIIGQQNQIDLAMLPVGDNFTMGMSDAVEALKWLKPAQVVPIHYNTFPPIQVEIKEFPAMAEVTGVSASVLEPGHSLTL